MSPKASPDYPGIAAAAKRIAAKPDPTTVLRTAAWQGGWDREEFDRVLAEAKAEAWDQGFAVGHDAGVLDEDRPANPYRNQT